MERIVRSGPRSSRSPHWTTRTTCQTKQHAGTRKGIDSTDAKAGYQSREDSELQKVHVWPYGALSSPWELLRVHDLGQDRASFRGHHFCGQLAELVRDCVALK